VIARDPWRSLGIAAACLVVYLGNGRLIPTDDAIPARYLPVSVLRHGTLTLDPFPDLVLAPRPYYLQHVNGHVLSSYPVGAAVLATPFFVDAVFAATDPDAAWLRAREKIAAAVLAALSVGVLSAAFGRLLPWRAATALALVYGLGTSTFSTSSQALWQHGPAALCLTVALYAYLRHSLEPAWRWAAIMGLAVALACVCRPVVVLSAVPLAVACLWRDPRRAGAMALGALAPALFQAWYGAHYFGNPFHIQFSPTSGANWAQPIGAGLAGVLLSPGRGLFIYSPVFIGSVVGAAIAVRHPQRLLFGAAALGAVATIVVVAKWTMWWGGACYGPRLLADLAPSLTLLLVPVVPHVGGSRLRILIATGLVSWSVGAHAIGAYCGDISWNVRVDVDRHPDRLWSWTDNQPSECLRLLFSTFSRGHSQGPR
jgi:hypothetical protein